MSATETAARWLAILTSLALAASASAEPGSVSMPVIDWHRSEVAERAAGAAAVARDPRSGELAVGDEDGLLIGRPGQTFRRVSLRGAVADLAYAPDGVLLAATSRGLQRIDAEGRSSEVAPGPGASAREIRRIAVLPGATALATGDGVFVSSNTQVWQKLSGALPAGPAAGVVLQRRDALVRCWASINGELWRVDLLAAAGGFEAAASERVVMPFVDHNDGVQDLAADLGIVELVVVLSQSLVVWRGGAVAGPADPRWQTLRPELPPGARLRRLARGAGRWWLATNRGLLTAPDLAGPWRRSEPPAGRFAVSDLVAAADIVVAAGEEGLLIGRPRPPAADVPAAAGEGAPGLVLPSDPPIERVHRAAVRHLGLDRSRMEALRRGAHRRGWLPLVTVRGGAEWDHSRNIDHDEAFLSGDMRHLIDRGIDRGDAYDVSLLMTWDLGDVAYEPESIDVSRETREVIELRDDVLDEITQLYFERRAVLAALRAPGAQEPAESLRLRLRADELAAGIDAWTGGWFAAQVSALAPDPPVPPLDAEEKK